MARLFIYQQLNTRDFEVLQSTLHQAPPDEYGNVASPTSRTDLAIPEKAEAFLKELGDKAKFTYSADLYDVDGKFLGSSTMVDNEGLCMALEQARQETALEVRVTFTPPKNFSAHPLYGVLLDKEGQQKALEILEGI